MIISPPHAIDPSVLTQVHARVHVGVWTWDVPADVIAWNDELFRLFGLEPQSLDLHLGTFLEFVHPRDRERVESVIQDAIQRRKPYEIEHAIVTPDGDVRTLLGRGFVVCDATRTVQRVVGTAIDITQRAAEQEALRQSEERFRSMFEQSAIGIAITDRDRIFQRVNASFARMIGRTPAEVVGKSVVELTHPDDVEMTEDLYRNHTDTGAMTYEKRYVRGDGGVAWVRVTVSQLRGEDGCSTGFLGMVEDITEHKSATETLRRQSERLVQSQRMEALGQLAGGVAHDFNNILTVIQACATFIQDAALGQNGILEDVKQIDLACRRAEALTRQLLAFSRRQMLKPEVVDVNVALNNLSRTLHRLLGEHIELAIVPSADPSTVRVDAYQLEQVVINLLVNARDAIHEKGTITIGTTNARRCDRDFVALTVADDGEGIPPAVRDRIFEPFFTTKAVGKGTGLGLATVHGIVEQSDGLIELESEVGKGTTFRILLPQVLADAHHSGDHESVEDLRGSETVLLVEDEAGVRGIARRVLSELGYDVLEARHGADAMTLVAGHHGSLGVLVTDVIMPEMGGRELALQIRKANPGLPVLYVSGYTDDELLRRGILEPGTQLLRKPFLPHELARAVRRLLDIRSESCPLPSTLSS